MTLAVLAAFLFTDAVAAGSEPWVVPLPPLAKPITLVEPYGAGGGVDVIALVGAALADRLRVMLSAISIGRLIFLRTADAQSFVQPTSKLAFSRPPA